MTSSYVQFESGFCKDLDNRQKFNGYETKEETVNINESFRAKHK
jgi:hypothetical protein